MKYIVANWKANKTTTEVKRWMSEVRKTKIKLPEKIKVILCPSFLHLSIIKRHLKAYPLSFELKLGAQNISPYPEGTYTGEIAAPMLAEFVGYVIVGHSERRCYFKETDKQIRLKVAQALKNNIVPIVAFSELSQPKFSVKGLRQKERKEVMFMYEPPEAISKQINSIGVGKAASLFKVLKMVNQIKRIFPKNKVLYGGSVKSYNIAKFITVPELDGVVPGTASQNAKEFIKMLLIASQAVRLIEQ